MLDVLIVEDEIFTQEAIRLVVMDLGHDVVGVAKDAITVIDILKNRNVDLIFLDINIKGSKDGIWLACYIKKHYNIPFVFLTGRECKKITKMAVKTGPLAYLTKPFKEIDIFSVLEIGVNNIQLRNSDEYMKTGANHKVSTETESDKNDSVLFIKDKHAYKKILVQTICFIESDGNYLKIYTADKKFLIRNTLKDFFKILPPFFIQVQRSFIVNSNKVKKISTLCITMEDDFKIPIGTLYKEEIKKNLRFFS